MHKYHAFHLNPALMRFHVIHSNYKRLLAIAMMSTSIHFLHFTSSRNCYLYFIAALKLEEKKTRKMCDYVSREINVQNKCLPVANGNTHKYCQLNLIQF